MWCRTSGSLAEELVALLAWRHYRPGEVVWRAGDASAGLVVIARGRLELEAIHSAHLAVTRSCEEAIFFPSDDVVPLPLRLELELPDKTAATVVFDDLEEERAVRRLLVLRSSG